MELGFQLYSARLAPRLETTLERLAAIGYTHVEPYGSLYGDVPALRDAMARAGVAARSGHFDLASLERDVDGVLRVAESLGIDVLVVPYLEDVERPAGAAGWHALGARVEAIAAEVASAGKRLAWHNHDFEVAVLGDGSMPLAHLLEGAPSLAWQGDVAWLARAGVDPWVLLDIYRDRLVSVHLKDVAPAGECADEDGWADFGHGIVDWETHWSSTAGVDAALRVVEHDRPSDALRFARRAYASVARLDAGRDPP